jgi:GNAT superfamily N-acetyltransferase
MTTPITHAHPHDAQHVATIIATAFSELDVAAWLVPDPNERPHVLYAQFRILIDHALDHGTVHMSANRHAAAVWFPRDTPPPQIHQYNQRLEMACGRYTDRFRALDTAFDNHHPTAPHHHLALLAVDHDHQSRGHGTALLNHHHARLDQTATPAYLEASSIRSRGLYLRHGYHDHGPPIELPDHGPRLWPMWRQPQPTE